MPRIYINGKPLDVTAGENLLTSARLAGIQIPTLCADPRVKPLGACRMCLVQVEGERRPVAACSTMVREGMKVETHTPEIEKFRKGLLELLAGGYPAEALRETPEKPFHKLLGEYGVACSQGITATIDDRHPYIRIDLSRCILCGRCVRICEEVQGQFVWSAWGRGDAIELRAGLAGSLLESSCTSCGTCVDSCPTGALDDKRVIALGKPTEWTRSICPYCGTGCEIDVGTRNSTLIQVKPVLHAAVNKGHLCSKGRYAFEYVLAPDRVLHPMIRRHGKWENVSWNEAIAAAAHALHKAIAAHGPDSVGVLGSARSTNEEAYLAQKFARVVVGTNNVDCCARVCHAPSAAALKAMLGTSAATNCFDDIERSRTILLWGCNPTENHPVVGARIKHSALRETNLIVVDPRKTELAELADIHLQIRPGTDIPVLLALASIIVEEKLFDPHFIDKSIENWEGFKDFAGKWRAESVAPICGVDPGVLRAAARMYAQAGPAMSFHGLGLTEHLQGTEAVMCLVNLALLTGNLGKPGTGINPLRGQNNVQGAAVMGCDPAIVTGAAPIETAIARFQTKWNCELPIRRGLDLLEMMDAAQQKRLKVLWAIGYDVLLTNPDMAVTRDAFSNLDDVIVQDMFLNETACEYGTIFLPACSSFEKDGTFMNAERRVQRVRAALCPAGESKPDWSIICNVAYAMGCGKQFGFASPEDVWNEIGALWPSVAGISYSRLDEQGLQWPCPNESHSGTAILFDSGWTAEQKLHLYCPDTQVPMEEPNEKFPFILVTGRTLQQFNAGTMTGRTLNQVLRPTDTLDIAPCDAQSLGIRNADSVSIRSHYGEIMLPARITSAVPAGVVFASFNHPQSQLNLVTGRGRDRITNTPQYKVTLVALQKVVPSASELLLQEQLVGISGGG
jgi:formate dehydrogenase major subunit